MSVDRTGTYRFDKVLESGVSITRKSEVPSFNVRLRISEFFDEEEGVWVDWSSAEAEISAYFCLFGKDKKTGKVGPILNHAQIMKVFGWEGNSFQILANDDYSKIKGQLRIADNDPDFAAKNPYTVEWIDVFDADPVRQLNKLDDKELKDLDAKFASVLKASGKAPAAASVKRDTKPTGPNKKSATPPPATKKEAEEPKMTDAEKKAAIKAKSEKNRAAAKGEKPGPPPTRKPEPGPEPETTEEPDVTEPAEEEGGVQYTKQQAWEIVVEMKADSVTDEQLNEAWNDAIEAIAGDVDHDDITKKQWGEIYRITLDTEYEDGYTIGKF